MKLKRRAHRQQSETIIALIDVVFFLLVFFMLIGRMDANAPFEVLPAFSVTGSELPTGGATVAVSESGSLALNGSEISQSELLGELASAVAEDPALFVRMNAHKDAEMQDILPLVASIESLGIKDIALVVSPGTDQ